MTDKKVVTREEYYSKHTLCPNCKTNTSIKATNIIILTSEARDFKDNLNTAWCLSCGWRGMRNQLLEEIETPVIEIPVPNGSNQTVPNHQHLSQL